MLNRNQAKALFDLGTEIAVRPDPVQRLPLLLFSMSAENYDCPIHALAAIHGRTAAVIKQVIIQTAQQWYLHRKLTDAEWGTMTQVAMGYHYTVTFAVNMLISSKKPEDRTSPSKQCFVYQVDRMRKINRLKAKGESVVPLDTNTNTPDEYAGDPLQEFIDIINNPRSFKHIEIASILYCAAEDHYKRVIVYATGTVPSALDAVDAFKQEKKLRVLRCISAPILNPLDSTTQSMQMAEHHALSSSFIVWHKVHFHLVGYQSKDSTTGKPMSRIHFPDTEQTKIMNHWGPRIGAMSQEESNDVQSDFTDDTDDISAASAPPQPQLQSNADSSLSQYTVQKEATDTLVQFLSHATKLLVIPLVVQKLESLFTKRELLLRGLPASDSHVIAYDLLLRVLVGDTLNLNPQLKAVIVARQARWNARQQ